MHLNYPAEIDFSSISEEKVSSISEENYILDFELNAQLEVEE